MTMPASFRQLPQSLRTFAGKRAVRRTAIGILAFVILIGLFGYFILPGIVKTQAEKLLTEKLHRQTTIGKVEINPYTLRVTLHDFVMKEPQGGATFASFDTLTVGVSYQSLWRLAPVVHALRLVKPYVHLVREDATHYNIDDLLALGGGQPKTASKPARFSLFNIQIDQGRVDFVDRTTGLTHTVTNLQLGVPFISSLPSQADIYVQPLLSADVDGTPLLLKGKARPFADPRDAVVDLDLDGLDLTSYLKYLPGTPHFKVPSARLDLHVQASFRQPAGKAPELALDGTVQLKSLLVQDAQGKTLVKLAELGLRLQNTQPFGNRLDLAGLTVDGLEADVARDARGGFNFENLLSLPTSPAAAKPAAKPAPAAPSADAPASGAGVHVTLAQLDIRNAALRYADTQAAQPLSAGVDKLNLSAQGIDFDGAKKTVAINAVTSDSAALTLLHGKPRTAHTAAAASHPAAHAGNKASAGAPYTVSIGKIDVTGWSAHLEDRSLKRPAVTDVAPFTLSLRNVSTAPGSRGQIELHASVNKAGRLGVKGEFGIAPLHADLALDLKNVDIMQAQPYFTEQVNVLLTRADVSADGRLRLDQDKRGALTGGYDGSLTLGNVATIDKVTSSDFLRWRALAFGGVRLKLHPFALDVNRVALNDFFARIIIDSSGHLNLQDVQRSGDQNKSVTEDASGGNAAHGNKRTVVLPPSGKPARSNMPPIRIGKVVLHGGQVRFTDNFIQPNYTANLMKLGGTVTGLSSDPRSNADVKLTGLVNSAPLNVAGHVNPLKGDLSLDLKADVHGMEMAPLSPYSGRYIGYGIEKGKLSFDVEYKVENRVLTAQNHLVLDQLTLGDKVDSPTATKLPVRFALALLRDRNGVIDVNLPIGGSLDDPQFSVGGLVIRIFVNLIEKAVTAPFSLISSMFGGGEELSNLAFDPGRATLGDKADDKLKALAKALNDRPALKLDITGRYDPQADRAGLKRANIDRQVRALKLKDIVSHGGSADPDSVTVTPQEYPALLKRVYSNAKFSKPRNFIGMQKDLPVADMEKLMMDNTTVTDNDLVDLGNRRAQAAKDWLTANGKVSADRIFILAAKPGNDGAQKKGTAPATRVDFSLK